MNSKCYGALLVLFCDGTYYEMDYVGFLLLPLCLTTILKQIKLVGGMAVTLASLLPQNFTLPDESFNTITRSTTISPGPRRLDRKKLGKEQTNQQSNLATSV